MRRPGPDRSQEPRGHEPHGHPADRGPGADRALREIGDRVLWLATAIIDHAARVGPNPGGLEVGGHQAPSASMVAIMPSLWREQLQAEDRVTACRESGDLDSVYRHHGLDVDSVVSAALDLAD